MSGFPPGASFAGPITGTSLTVTGTAAVGVATAAGQAPQLSQVSPKFTITAGALPTQVFISGTGAQVLTTRDAEVNLPVTFTPGAATTATCLIELSPDNTTYTSIGTETVPAGTALDSFIHILHLRVPAGWWARFTVNAQATLGTAVVY